MALLSTTLRKLFFGDFSNQWKAIQNAAKAPTEASIMAALLVDANGYGLTKEGTPVNAVAASATLTTDNTNVTDGKTVTIGSVVYRFKDTMAAINDIKIGADADTTLGNLVAAINGAEGAGTKYYTGTAAHTLVSAAAVANHATVITAKTKGTAGNAIAKATNEAHLDWDGTGAVFTGGVNGTVGTANAVCTDGSYLYVCIAANTIADANWRRVSLGTAY